MNRPTDGGPLVCLYDMDLVLVVERPTGVHYWNQVGGTYCLQYAVEGALVPIENEICPRPIMVGYQLIEIFASGEHLNGLDEASADAIDAVLGAADHTRVLSVDRSRLRQCTEAWLYVRVSSQPALGASSTPLDFYGFGECTGVPTWSNSD